MSAPSISDNIYDAATRQLISACRKLSGMGGGDLRKIEDHLRNGADPNARYSANGQNERRFKPLKVPAKFSPTPKGKDMSIAYGNCLLTESCPLADAIMAENANAVKSLLSAGADPNVICVLTQNQTYKPVSITTRKVEGVAQYKRPLLALALESENVAIIDAMVEAGANGHHLQTNLINEERLHTGSVVKWLPGRGSAEKASERVEELASAYREHFSDADLSADEQLEEFRARAFADLDKQKLQDSFSPESIGDYMFHEEQEQYGRVSHFVSDLAKTNKPSMAPFNRAQFLGRPIKLHDFLLPDADGKPLAVHLVRAGMLDEMVRHVNAGGETLHEQLLNPDGTASPLLGLICELEQEKALFRHSNAPDADHEVLLQLIRAMPEASQERLSNEILNSMALNVPAFANPYQGFDTPAAKVPAPHSDLQIAGELGNRNGNFSQLDLRTRRMQGLDGTYAEFVGSYMPAASLESAALNFASFAGVTWVNGTAENADMVDATFSGVTLGVETNISGTHFKQANLSGANLGAVLAEKTNFQNANLLGADLSAAKLEGASFKGAIIIGAQIDNAEGINTDGAIDSAEKLAAQLKIDGQDTRYVKMLLDAAAEVHLDHTGKYGKFTEEQRTQLASAMETACSKSQDLGKLQSKAAVVLRRANERGFNEIQI